MESGNKVESGQVENEGESTLEARSKFNPGSHSREKVQVLTENNWLHLFCIYGTSATLSDQVLHVLERS